MNESNQQQPGSPPPALMSAVAKLLRPLIKLLLSYQITYPLLITLLKSLYVEVAEKEFQTSRKRQSDSRINLLTGVHRKDVKRLRSEQKEPSMIPTAVSTGAQIIGQWLGSPEYVNQNGEPQALPLRSAKKPGVTFEDLVEKVCKQDIRPRVILDEWQRLGVARVEDNTVVLNTGAFTPDKGFDEKAFYFGKNLQDHMLASTLNLMGEQPPYFDRSVYYDKLTENSVKELNATAELLGMSALIEMNKQALSKQNDDKNKANANYRMNFGIFNFNTREKNQN